MLRKIQFQKLLIYLRSSLWFAPSLLILCAIILAFSLLEIDRNVGAMLRDAWPRFFVTEAEGARGMLSAIATSMATVAGVAFSITMVTMTLASTQYTSRVLRNFMRDRSNQIVLGVFVAVYVYCLLVLRSVSGEKGGFVPSIAIFGGVVLAIVAMGFFIFFIHHVSASIQASDIAASITRETLGVVERMFPEKIGDVESQQPEPALPQGATWRVVPSHAMGYIQGIDMPALEKFAEENAALLRLECRIGHFVAPGRPLVSLALDREPDRKCVDKLNKLYSVAPYRTIDQDATFGIRQLVDIALKALSPGINDTTTAVTCIEHLSVILACCANRRLSSPCYIDRNGPWLFSQDDAFEGLVALSFSQILENAEDNTETLIQSLVAIEHIARATRHVARLKMLMSWAEIIEGLVRQRVNSRYAQLRINEVLRAIRLSTPHVSQEH